ncbi:type I restriction endonuclease [Escherichia coli]
MVNGLPLVQIELKKRGVGVSFALQPYNTLIKLYFNNQKYLFNYIQLFFI